MPAMTADWYRWAIQSVGTYAIFTTDPKNRIVTWDRGAENLFGYGKDDVVGEDARFIFTPEDIRKRAPEIEAANAVADESAPDERWHVRKDGTIFWASGVMIKMLDDKRRHVGFVKIVRECSNDPGASPESASP